MSLSEFHFWCQKVLPLVYDDSLSYYEVLCKVTKYLNTTIQAVNDLADTITNYDELIAKLNTVYEGIEADVTELKTTITQKIEDNYTELNDKITQAVTNASLALDTLGKQLQAEIDAHSVSIDSINSTLTLLKAADSTIQEQLDALTQTVDVNYDTLDAKIDALAKEVYDTTGITELRNAIKVLQEQIKNVASDVYNYVLSRRVSFDFNNWTLYEHLGNALTSQQYCELGLTADEYAEYGIRALDYVKFSRDLLHYDWIYLPIVGGRQTHSIALDLLANYMYRTMTADAYAELGLDADGYANLDLTSFQYMYYPVTEESEFVPSGLNGLVQDLIAKVDAATENLDSKYADIQNRMSGLEEANANALYISDTADGITADDYAKITYMTTN